jgi:flagellar basal-body rod protein FlgB
MKANLSGLFTNNDQIEMLSLSLRDQRNKVIAGNIANAETPGFRALGYDFEDQLKELVTMGQDLAGAKTGSRAINKTMASIDGIVRPEVFVRPTETVGEDGNTVDADNEMIQMSENQILFRATVESINRRIAILKYAINGGR